jgi:nucleoside-diphosphate kinase
MAYQFDPGKIYINYYGSVNTTVANIDTTFPAVTFSAPDTLPTLADEAAPPCNCIECQTKKGKMAKFQSEFSFVMYKPDAFERGLVGELMRLVDDKGLQLVQAKTMVVTADQLAKHYNHHVGKSFWPEMVDFYTSGTTLACVYNGVRANDCIRQLIGSKHPSDSPPGSIRGKYATSFPRNLIHGSDSTGDAQREMAIFFTKEELAQINENAINKALAN